MAGQKAVFYLDTDDIAFVKQEQYRRDLKSPSAALRAILDQVKQQPAVNEHELNLLADILEQNTENARRALTQAFDDLEETKRRLDASL